MCVSWLLKCCISSFVISKLHHRYFDGLVFHIVNFKWSGEMLFVCKNILCMLMIGGGRVTVCCQTLSVVIALETR